MVQAIAKRRQLPTSGTPMESLESTRGVSRPGPNSSAAFAAGKEMTLTSLSVSSAKRTGPGAFGGAGNAGRQRRLIYDAMESTHDLRRIESRSPGKDQCEAGKQHAQVPPRVIASADAAVPDAQ